MHSTQFDKYYAKSMLLLLWRGKCMYKKLNEKQIKRFAQRYLPDWQNDIYEVSLLKYAGVKEYLVNEHYFVIVDKDKITEKDTQEL